MTRQNATVPRTIVMEPAHHNPSARASSVLGLLLILLMTGCSTPARMSSEASRPQFLYADNFGDNTILAYRINPATGALEQVPGSPFKEATSGAISTNPAGTFAYVQDFFGGKIWAYGIETGTGALSIVPASPFATGYQDLRIAMSPAGSFAYVASAYSSTLSAYRVDVATGTLSPIPGSPFPVASTPLSVTIDPAGSFAYVVSGNDGMVSVLDIDAVTGALAPTTNRPLITGTHTGSITISPNGLFAYMAGPGALAIYKVNPATGALTPTPKNSLLAKDRSSYSVAINPANTFAYMGHFYYRINTSTGLLTKAGTTPFTTGGPLTGSSVFSAHGVFVYQITGQGIAAARINPVTGALTPVPGSPFAAGANPSSLAVAQPAGAHGAGH